MKQEIIEEIDLIISELAIKGFIVTHDGTSNLYDEAVSFLKAKDLIKTERHNNRYVANSKDIQEIRKLGIKKYLEENNRIKELEVKVMELNAENLKLQNKQLKRNVIYSIIGFFAGVIVTHLKDILILLNIMPQE